MKDLSKYHHTTVRIVCESGDTISGACDWYPPEYGLSEFDVEEESLRIGDYMLFENDIREIELLRKEACFPVRAWPEAKKEIAVWFHERWHIPLEAYRESIRDCIRKEIGVPQWYVVVQGDRIIAGCGVIENDFHERKDLTPNVCAVYVDEEYRNQGVAGFMLQYACDDMSAVGFNTLYLLTDHIGFYERYGWQFSCMVRGNDGKLSRMYVRHTESETKEFAEDLPGHD